MSPTRREMMKRAAGVGAIAAATVALPRTALPIPGLTQVETLVKLASEGKFLSAELQLPPDHHTTDFAFYLDGVEQTDDKLFFKEIYAPGDGSGWAVIYNRSEPWDGGTRVVRGRWTVERR